ncbi:MAG: VWA domain-containing protein [Thermoleophilaceae bacterium]|nr:VWA domain-containing protein [Thermoleophilaceae bacterium]
MPEPRPRYPFSAVVGQDDYKLALLANAVDPAIGGVLAVGERGTAKSTLARSFAALLPQVSKDEDAELAPFVELPLGATVDRLTGSLDTAKLLAGEGAVLSDGMLAAADGGVLYADEVNLLGDHLVDVLLDAAAFGFVRVERDGLSAEQSARFVLVGTMNPEEGALRPQLLDRFGLSVTIAAPLEPSQRAEIVQRRIAFEQYPGIFCERFEGTEHALREIVERARAAWLEVDLPDETLNVIAEACSRLGVEGMRADIVITRTATALAALDDRRSVIDRDIETAARLALPHRARTTASEQQWFSEQQILEAFAQARGESTESEPAPDPRVAPPRTQAGYRETSRRQAPDLDQGQVRSGSGPVGRSSKAEGGERPAIDSRPAASTDDLDVIATARAAVTRRIFQGPGADPAEALGGTGSDVMNSGPGDIRAEDLRERVRAGREANLVLCVVDASSSVLENGRGGELRALLGGLVADARRKRDRVGLIVFRGREARLVAPPSRNHAAVLAGLETVEPGGTTPLAEGIRVAHDTATRELRRNPDLRPIVALVTDGYANVSRSGDALGEARTAARALRRDGITLVVIGETGSGAPQFARATGAEFYPFDPPARRTEAA